MEIVKENYNATLPDKFQIVYRFPYSEDLDCWQWDLGINIFKGGSWVLGIGLIFITIEFWLDLNKEFYNDMVKN